MKTSSFDRLAHATDAKGFIILCLLLRFGMAILLLYAAWAKITAPDWSAAGYLKFASGPFALWFQSLAGNALVDGLVMYGELLIGLAFLFGCLIKPAAFFNIILMMLFFVSGWIMNTSHGPVNEHIIYALVSGLFLFGEFGHWYGLDYFISRTKFVQSRSWLLRLF
ncbi:hypothetical protein A3C09_01260 [Candidatus Uhrbacteria bacterium RIFCSPHIGHO2_02_FULL_47_44]|uniref:DoxX family protein n=1 Tax=Candidatus Uhrbacteria bacterium RIFCSPLOWO2_02_FULL_48_18 TaxID=1802408 RepID=A0A1F7V9Z9_9BACT|nr:MAG: hypothetical protein A2839_05250 [Candidatus Uhrbacteria bacterium RIFCSPHIGHO2_01_FULL_47_10]OGL69794.1 MAG: hypothetical protein A3C09_01260 [Candidatus Uhrbacteria bacterium RIFCSPHIGHO2_02_FULL_47_44]OGL77415.1 MAG: hypothetical protein A3E97_00310 [Candidatus Uhrbacteria bacterium RIFCSPHIGHO2_12_FULL_47_12]OGL81775.1 MAG: hypothetical protein A3B20_01625 [Candidatus Uhrbacteria bacterium RIFCSPLOWO2_01_FULL_47_17]OGL86938.1 MAG: hypothetical protein A3I41_03215 [Candidatus Uhrbact